MRIQSLHTTVKLVGVVILVLMVAAIGYAGFISFTHWHGIGV